ncbi:MAG: hypothetical protein CALGDGBN_00794 [Pseudomonadales bacterium]|nr:hypothetical protein [Pseudomonadales bacterium]
MHAHTAPVSVIVPVLDELSIVAALDRQLRSAPGRALQMNAGAKIANRDILLFLHADTRIEPSAIDTLCASLVRSRTRWGCFDVRIAGRSRWLPLVAALMNLRSRLSGIATGDQAIFARAPAPGQAKTRLIPALGAIGAAALARRMLRHTLGQALAVPGVQVELCVTPGPHAPQWRYVALPEALSLRAQDDGDLGERLARAARRCVREGARPLLVGTDCPALHTRRLHAAANTLDSTASIGARRTCSSRPWRASAP